MATTPRPSVRLRRLASRLLELRESAGVTQEEIAERAGMNRSTLYRLENALQRPQKSTLVQLLDLYGVTPGDDRRDQLLTLLKESKQRGWLQQYRDELPDVYSDYIGFENDAQTIRNYESLFVPGLLQTEAYARAQVRGTLPEVSEAEVETRVAARLARQAVLSKETPPKLWVIMDEAALRRTVGDPGVMQQQIEHLLKARTQPHVTIQVIPFGAGAHPGMDGAFVILDFPRAHDQSLVYVESKAGGLFLEEETDLDRYTMMYNHLRATASGLDATAALLQSMREA